MAKQTGPWVESNGGEVRYPDPLDGRTWSLDGTPRWLASVSPCCEGEALHFVWGLSDPDEGAIERPGGSEKTMEEAKQKADEALRERGWESHT